MLSTAVIQAIEYQKKKVYFQGADAAYLTSGTSVLLINAPPPPKTKPPPPPKQNLNLKKKSRESGIISVPKDPFSPLFSILTESKTKITSPLKSILLSIFTSLGD